MHYRAILCYQSTNQRKTSIVTNRPTQHQAHSFACHQFELIVISRTSTPLNRSSPLDLRQLHTLLCHGSDYARGCKYHRCEFGCRSTIRHTVYIGEQRCIQTITRRTLKITMTCSTSGPRQLCLHHQQWSYSVWDYRKEHVAHTIIRLCDHFDRKKSNANNLQTR